MRQKRATRRVRNEETAGEAVGAVSCAYLFGKTVRYWSVSTSLVHRLSREVTFPEKRHDHYRRSPSGTFPPPTGPSLLTKLGDSGRRPRGSAGPYVTCIRQEGIWSVRYGKIAWPWNLIDVQNLLPILLNLPLLPQSLRPSDLHARLPIQYLIPAITVMNAIRYIPTPIRPSQYLHYIFYLPCISHQPGLHLSREL